MRKRYTWKNGNMTPPSITVSGDLVTYTSSLSNHTRDLKSQTWVDWLQSSTEKLRQCSTNKTSPVEISIVRTLLADRHSHIRTIRGLLEISLRNSFPLSVQDSLKMHLTSELGQDSLTWLILLPHKEVEQEKSTSPQPMRTTLLAFWTSGQTQLIKLTKTSLPLRVTFCLYLKDLSR